MAFGCLGEKFQFQSGSSELISRMQNRAIARCQCETRLPLGQCHSGLAWTSRYLSNSSRKRGLRAVHPAPVFAVYAIDKRQSARASPSRDTKGPSVVPLVGDHIPRSGGFFMLPPVPSDNLRQFKYSDVLRIDSFYFLLLDRSRGADAWWVPGSFAVRNNGLSQLCFGTVMTTGPHPLIFGLPASEPMARIRVLRLTKRWSGK
jgi:hypothetical protein